jgi:hypothetical protein
VRLGVILIGLLLCRAASGQALEERPVGSAGLAMAGAGVSSLRGPASLWINPALLPLAGSRVTLELGLLGDSRQLSVTTEVNESTPPARDLDGVHLSPAVALAYPLGLRWLWGGLAYRVARQIHSRYPALAGSFDTSTTPATPAKDAPGRYLGGELTLEQHVIALALGVASRRVGLGASLELSHVRLAHRRSLWAGAVGDAARLTDGRYDLDAFVAAQGSLSVGALFGAWAQPLPWLELGAALRLPVTASLDGTFSLAPVGGLAPSGTTGILAQGGSARLDWRLPLEVRGGLTLGPPRWRLLLEAAFQRWSSANDPVARLTDAAVLLRSPSGTRTLPLPELPLGLGLRDSWSLHAAAEVAPWGSALVFRTGWAFHSGASTASLPSPVLLDLPRHVLGLGLQAQLGWLRLGAAFAYSFESEQRVDDNSTQLVNPVAPAVTAAIGAGSYKSSRVFAILEAGAGW